MTLVKLIDSATWASLPELDIAETNIGSADLGLANDTYRWIHSATTAFVVAAVTLVSGAPNPITMTAHAATVTTPASEITATSAAPNAITMTAYAATVETPSSAVTVTSASPASITVTQYAASVSVTGDSPVVATDTFNIASGTSSQSISLPTSLENDVVCVFAANENGTGAGGFATATGSEGWSVDFDNLDGSGPGAGFIYKRMGATPDTAVTIGGATNRIVAGAIIVFRGINETTVLDAGTVLGTINSYTGGAITTVTDNAIVLSANFLDDDDVAGSGIPPTGYTMIVSADTTHDDGASGCTIDIAYKIVETFGTETPGAWTGLDDASRTYTIALRPAA